MNFIKRLFEKKETTNTNINKSKDPSDYKKCSLSSEWYSDNHYCTKCKKSTGHNEYMSDICNGCGSFDTQKRFGRSYRKIMIEGKWKYQVRYKNGNEEIIDKWY
ncbi:hypothetical protein Phi19:3_gp060 [Cellulophaga phage phi19:3]|uniref:Uncharacterized protein n=1 Tax=Cellulophaga phage phi19:3 TaxID=1327971 RepID=R9ZW93_9CAUD|nr:hypothetical protein Phi19:3_gp060 [Cellulophaga phage phi19:3]AGO47464.1 hypothetical protein Phi19:3_gp060 [Cellulophaga phage phi19:3]